MIVLKEKLYGIWVWYGRLDRLSAYYFTVFFFTVDLLKYEQSWVLYQDRLDQQAWRQVCQVRVATGYESYCTE